MTDPIAQLFARRKAKQAEWERRMLHDVPDAPVVDREAFIIERCRGKRVLNIGCVGTDGRGRLHERIREVAEVAYGLDRDGADFNMNLDAVPWQDSNDPPWWESAEVCNLIVLGEVLEHLANPGYVLKQLRDVPPEGGELIITVPNAFGPSRTVLKQTHTECVNADHVAWYSYHTLRTLVERYGYTVREFAWYNGEPLTAEGLIMVVVP